MSGEIIVKVHVRSQFSLIIKRLMTVGYGPRCRYLDEVWTEDDWVSVRLD